MSSTRTEVQEDTDLRVLGLLQENPQMSQRELAAAVGISVGGTHHVLTALIHKGLVTLDNFTASSDKRPYANVLTSKGLAGKDLIARRFLTRRMQEYDILRSETDALKSEMDRDYSAVGGR